MSEAKEEGARANFVPLTEGKKKNSLFVYQSQDFAYYINNRESDE